LMWREFISRNDEIFFSVHFFKFFSSALIQWVAASLCDWIKMDIRKTLLIFIAFVIIATVQPGLQALPIKEEIENPEGINDGAKAFDQHNLRQLYPDRFTDPKFCKIAKDCCNKQYCDFFQAEMKFKCTGPKSSTSTREQLHYHIKYSHQRRCHGDNHCCDGWRCQGVHCVPEIMYRDYGNWSRCQSPPAWKMFYALGQQGTLTTITKESGSEVTEKPRRIKSKYFSTTKASDNPE